MYQAKDAALFALALWLAHLLRRNLNWPIFENHPLEEFREFAWLYVIIFPGVPLILEIQGFYQRQLLARRRDTVWLLFKGCTFVTIGVILVMFLFKMTLARLVIVFFGMISFILVYLSEELLRWGYKSKFAKSRLHRRVLLVGTEEDTSRMRADLEIKREEEIQFVGELDLNKSTIADLVTMMHERSPNNVILNGKHTYFGQIEKAIQACELEGVEAWLVAHFFQTQISRTSLDDFYGRPVIVFRSAPEASWQGVAKQLLDFLGAALLIVVLTPVFIIASLAIKLSSRGPVCSAWSGWIRRTPRVTGYRRWSTWRAVATSSARRRVHPVGSTGRTLSRMHLRCSS